MTRCPHPARLQAYGAGALPGEQREDLRRHLDGCDACRALLEAFSQVEPIAADAAEVTALRRRIEPAVQAARRERQRPGRWRLLVWASVPAFAVALVLLVVGLRQRQGNPSEQPATAAAPVRDVTLLARLEPAPVELPLEDLLVTRSTGAPGLPPELVVAFQSYQRGEYPQAAERFGEAARKGPARFEVHFYRGVALLLSGQAGEAVAALQEAGASASEEQTPKVRWYLAQAYLRLARSSPARAELDALCRAQGAFGRDACETLRRLDGAPE